MIEFRPFVAADLKALDLQFAQRDVQNLMDDEEYGEYCGLSEFAWTGLIDGRVVGAAGILRQQNHIGHCWMLTGDLLLRSGRTWALVVRKMREIIDEAHRIGMWRLWATVRMDHLAGEEFMKHLGFAPECILECYDPDGSHHIQYKKIDHERVGL